MDYQIRSLLIFLFNQNFIKLEKKLKEIFCNSIQGNIYCKSMLYFYSGATFGNDAYINYEGRQIPKHERYFKENDLFKDLNLNKIIRIDKKEKLVNEFSLIIDSINHSMITFTFHDICLKLIAMRNILSHELDDISFEDKHSIELLSDANLDKYSSPLPIKFDVKEIEVEEKQILSNLIYMQKILDIIDENN